MTITSTVFFITTLLLLYATIKFGRTILAFQDSLEESLDIIDEKYVNINSILERPLFYDSKEVREVLNDIKATRSALHQVAYSLTRDFNLEEEGDERQEEN